MFYGLNIWAIIVAGLVFFIAGGLWYALIFSKSWQAALNFSDEVKSRAEKNFPKALLAHLICGLITAFVLTNLSRYMQAETFLDGIRCGFWVWFGFAFTGHFISYMFEKRPMNVLLINAGFYLVAYALMGGILTVWR